MSRLSEVQGCMVGRFMQGTGRYLYKGSSPWLVVLMSYVRILSAPTIDLKQARDDHCADKGFRRFLVEWVIHNDNYDVDTVQPCMRAPMSAGSTGTMVSSLEYASEVFRTRTPARHGTVVCGSVSRSSSPDRPVRGRMRAFRGLKFRRRVFGMMRFQISEEKPHDRQ